MTNISIFIKSFREASNRWNFFYFPHDDNGEAIHWHCWWQNIDLEQHDIIPLYIFFHSPIPRQTFHHHNIHNIFSSGFRSSDYGKGIFFWLKSSNVFFFCFHLPFPSPIKRFSLQHWINIFPSLKSPTFPVIYNWPAWYFFSSAVVIQSRARNRDGRSNVYKFKLIWSLSKSMPKTKFSNLLVSIRFAISICFSIPNSQMKSRELSWNVDPN